MRILHTADWHLGRLFHGLHLTEEQSYTLDDLIALTKSAHTDAVLIAGDIYDRAVPPVQAVQLLNETLLRLIKEAGQKVILIAGNHDNADRLGFGQELLAGEGLYITGPLSAGTRPVILEDQWGPVYFAPLTYGEPLAASICLGQPAENLTDPTADQDPAGTQPLFSAAAPKAKADRDSPSLFPEADLPATAAGDPASLPDPQALEASAPEAATSKEQPSTYKTHEAVVRAQIALQLAQIPARARKIALAHVFLAGAATSPDSERPLAIGGATSVAPEVFAAFNYTALGHLHMCQSFGPKIRYSGSLLKYSFTETTQKKGVHLIDLQEDGSFTAETVGLRTRHELACLTGSFNELLQHPTALSQEQFLQITLTDPAPILDAKYRLEQVYPHILHLQYQRLEAANQKDQSTSARQELGPYELFNSFFQQMNGRRLTAAEDKLLQQVLTQQLHQQQNGA